MDLRSELLPPLVNEQHLEALSQQIARISDRIQHNEPAAEAIEAFNKLTGHHYAPHDFAEYWASRSLSDFALEAARPAHPRVPDITRDEVAELIKRIMAADPGTDYYLRILDASLSHPAITDLIFYPPAELQDASPEQIADAAMSHRPIAL
ncbi:bacteriocin immunity protein [Actinomadura barringtoniae]|uniref:Bacteriocin immunity protein n=1 Tax=Actinomadura barringtoniae TaxID=1427535 RepID=A0A939P9E7_9ACTN|nr:bacteriocin immunity protein [Actinomadura barringtoniae]MBO2448243.1 bacteriocin immunity protein [Actinomadura barringtoniae]